MKRSRDEHITDLLLDFRTDVPHRLFTFLTCCFKSYDTPHCHNKCGNLVTEQDGVIKFKLSLRISISTKRISGGFKACNIFNSRPVNLVSLQNIVNWTF